VKYALLNGWTARRILFTLLGLGLALQAAIHGDWFGIIFGLYFTGMGILNVGCAGGNCSIQHIKDGK